MSKTIRDLRADEIDIRPSQATENGCAYLLYKDARCDMNILDETFGIFGWKREHTIKNGKEFCTVSVFDEDSMEWVSKEDTGTESTAEAVKGISSDAFKRSCVNWGIGRELYTSPFIFIKVPTEKDSNGKWRLSKPYPSLVVTELGIENKQIKTLVITNTKTNEVVYSYGKRVAARQEEYHLPVCEMCGQAIQPISGFTTNKIIEITRNKTGKQLCYECYRKVRVQENG